MQCCGSHPRLSGTSVLLQVETGKRLLRFGSSLSRTSVLMQARDDGCDRIFASDATIYGGLGRGGPQRGRCCRIVRSDDRGLDGGARGGRARKMNWYMRTTGRRASAGRRRLHLGVRARPRRRDAGRRPIRRREPARRSDRGESPPPRDREPVPLDWRSCASSSPAPPRLPCRPSSPS